MNLQVSDTATYECRVKKTTMATRKVVVTVQGMTRFFQAPFFSRLQSQGQIGHREPSSGFWPSLGLQLPALLQHVLPYPCVGLKATCQRATMWC